MPARFRKIRGRFGRYEAIVRWRSVMYVRVAVKAIMISAVLLDLMRRIKAASTASAPLWGVNFTRPDP